MDSGKCVAVVGCRSGLDYYRVAGLALLVEGGSDVAIVGAFQGAVEKKG